MSPSLSHNAPETSSEFYRCTLRVDGDLTVVSIGSVTVAASGRTLTEDPAPIRQCVAAARLTRPHRTLPPPPIYFADLDHAQRFAANSGGLWQADIDILPQPQPCEYVLVRENTTLVLPTGAPLFVSDLDHLIHLAAYEFDVTTDANSAARRESDEYR